MNIKNTVRKFMSTKINLDEISDSDNIFEKGLLSSLFTMQLVSFIEDKFDVTIENDELDQENFKSIDAISALLEKKII